MRLLYSGAGYVIMPRRGMMQVNGREVMGGAVALLGKPVKSGLGCVDKKPKGERHDGRTNHCAKITVCHRGGRGEILFLVFLREVVETAVL